LSERFIGAYNEEFSVAPAEPVSVFVTAAGTDLDQILCFEDRRVVGKDNVVPWEGLALQLPPQATRKSCAGLPVLVRRHLNRTFSVWCGPQCLARFSPTARLLTPSTATSKAAQTRAHEAA
jgi:hypothetical protein